MKSQTDMASVVFFGIHVLFLLIEIIGNSSVQGKKIHVHAHTAQHQMRYRRGKPLLTRQLQNITVHLGKTAIFRCEITGSPSRIRWRKNDVIIPHTRRYRARSYSWGGLLKIRNVRVTDYGLYSCKAKNKLGQVTSTKARLNIKGVNPLHTERCEVYTGNLCSAYLGKSVKMFIPFGQTQQGIEQNVQDTFRTISSYRSAQCDTYLLLSLCKHFFQPCDSTSAKPRPVPICKQDCIQLERETCQEVFTIAKAMSAKLRYHLPTCSRLPTGDRQNKPTNCQRIFTSKRGRIEPENFQENANQNNAEILRTLYTIIRGVPENEEEGQHYFIKSEPEAKSTDNQKFKGKCEPYIGKVCSNHIEAGKMIFISENSTQQGFETKLTNSLALVTTYTSPHCRKFALKALCYYFFPPCQENNLIPDLICRRDCELLEARICSKEFQYARTMPIAGEIIPDCSYLPVKQDSCLELGLPDQASEILTKQSSCSIYAMRRRSQGKLTPSRPHALHNNSVWCNTTFEETSFSLLPPVIRKQMQRFDQNVSTLGLGKLITRGEIAGYCVKFATTPEKLLNTSYMQTVSLPNMVHLGSHEVVPGLVVKLNKDNSTEIPLGFMPRYWPHKYIELEDVQLSYRLSKSHNTFVGRGLYRLCGTNFSVEIERTKYDFVRINGHSSDPVDVNTIEQAFGVEVPSEKFLEILKKYGVFLLRIMKPAVEIYVGDALSVKFSGISYVENLKTYAKTEILAGKLYHNYLLTAGIIFHDVSLGQMVSSFSGIYLKYLDMFEEKDGKNKIGLSLSAHKVDVTNIPFMAYTSEPLASSFTTTIPKGLYITVKTGTPKHCLQDQTLCRLIQVVLGKNTNFTLTGQTNWQWAHFKATIENTAMKNSLPVEKVEIEMKASNKTGMTFGVRPHLLYKVDGDVFVSKMKSSKVVFTGALYYVAGGRELTGQMKTNAVWKKAFGFPQLTIKRMRTGLSIRLVKPYFPNKLETRADFEIGLNCKNSYESDCITGTAFVGMSDEITEQYFHGVISRFNIRDILRVHRLRYILPSPIATIGFPEGLEISFSKRIHDLRPFGGPLMKPGFIMKGKIRVLGFESDCSVNLKPSEFIVDADINNNQGPIKLGGVTPLYRSRHDRKHGPKLFLEARFSPKPYVKAYIDGYTRIFGIFDEIRILMTRRHFMIRLVTSIFKSFKVRINVVANYSEDLSRTHFKAKIVFIGGLAKLTRAASKHIVAILMNENLKLQTARGEVNTLRSECQSESRKTCESCFQSSSCRNKLHSCKNSLNREKGAIYEQKARHFCQRLMKTNCNAGSADCKFLCKNSSLGNYACKSFDQSQRTVEDIKKGLFWVNQARVIFTSDLCLIHSITFETKLTPDDIGDIYVNAKLDVTLFGHRQRIEGVRLKFGIFARLASDIARHAVEWFRKSKT